MQLEATKSEDVPKAVVKPYSPLPAATTPTKKVADTVVDAPDEEDTESVRQLATSNFAPMTAKQVMYYR